MSRHYDEDGRPLPPDTMSDGEVMWAIVRGTKALMGLQVLSFERACLECAEACAIEAENLDDDAKARVRWLLEYLGYERQWYSEAQGGPMTHLWGRSDYWPFDLAAAAGKDQPVTYMVSMS